MAFLNGPQTQTSLLDLINRCQSFSIVTAWATPNNVFDAIKININKMQTIIIGVDFYQTSPIVLKWLNQNAPKKTRIGTCRNGIFHPKFYIFNLNGDDKRKVIIGSANLTNAAFNNNDELCLRIDANFESIRGFLNQWKRNSVSIANFDLDEYLKNYNISGAEIRILSGVTAFKRHPNLFTLSFDEYHFLCTQEKTSSNAYDQRIDLLDFCGNPNALANHNYFCSFSGLRPRVNFANQPSAGWFGNMDADFSFRDVVRDIHNLQLPAKNWNQPMVWQQLAALIYKMPRNITRNNYNQFIIDADRIIQAAVQHHRNHGYSYRNTNHFAAITRLLAMGRPDFFFCLNGANEKQLARDFGISVAGNTGIRSHNGYWDVADSLRNSTWANQQLNQNWPAEKQTCWHGRIAMVDALYYAF